MTDLVAVTGASGFIGRAVCAHLLDRGRRLRALLRRPDEDLEALGVEALPGSLEDEASLRRLVEDADAVVHCAGAVRARRAADFEVVNALGTASLAEAAAAAASRPRFLLLSSLAAREPGLSPYAASKRRAEQELARAAPGLERLCLRLPAVYGPGDRATLGLFQQFSRGLAVLPAPPGNRFSLLHINDLAGLIGHLLERPNWSGGVIEVGDARPGGYAWADLPEIAARRLGRPVRVISAPRAALWLTAAANEAISTVFGRAPIWTRGKLREFAHPDWVARESRAGELEGWRAKIGLEQGLPQTLLWYKEHGWL